MNNYNVTSKNKLLTEFLQQPITKEQMIESIIINSHGISTDDLKQCLQEKYKIVISKKNLYEYIITINRKYVEELDRQVIVHKSGKWWWR